MKASWASRARSQGRAFLLAGFPSSRAVVESAAGELLNNFVPETRKNFVEASRQRAEDEAVGAAAEVKKLAGAAAPKAEMAKY